jgi:hypothetical protein
MDEKTRAVMFALKLYAENSLLVGMLCDLNGKATKISDYIPLRYIDTALAHGVIYMVEDYYVFTKWYKYFVRPLTLKDVETFRKANGINKANIVPFLELYLNDSEEHRHIITYYTPTTEKIESIQELVSVSKLTVSEKETLLDYGLKFGTRAQYDKGIIPHTNAAHEAIKEIIQIAESGEFHYSGKRHVVTKERLFEAIGKIVLLKHVVHLKNNNYLKQPLMNKEGGKNHNTNVAKTREGY